MDWAEIDNLLWLWLVLKGISWLVDSAVAWMMAQGWIGQDTGQGILAFTKA